MVTRAARRRYADVPCRTVRYPAGAAMADAPRAAHDVGVEGTRDTGHEESGYDRASPAVAGKNVRRGRSSVASHLRLNGRRGWAR